MVAIEALAAERPVIATDAGGTATVVTEGVSGYLAPDRRRRRARVAGSRRLRATRRCARRSAARGARTCASALRRSGWPTTSKPCTGRSSRVEGSARPQAPRRERLREPSARAPAGASSRRHRRALPRPRRTRHVGGVLRASRRARRAVRARPLRRRSQPADGARCGAGGAGGAAGSAAHASRARRRLRCGCGAAAPRPVRLHAAQRRPLPPRALPVRRPRLRARRAPADRDLGRRAATSSSGRGTTAASW